MLAHVRLVSLSWLMFQLSQTRVTQTQAAGEAPLFRPEEKVPLFDFLGIEPVPKKRKEALKKDQQALSCDPLSYAELRRLGFSDLVEPIMDLGGYVAVSNALGIEVASLPPPPPPLELALMQKEEVKGMALGASLENMMASADFTKGRESPATDLDDNLPPRARGMTLAPAKYERVRVRARGDDEVMENEEGIPAGRHVELTLSQRLYAVVMAACFALAWGHASDEALSRGLLDVAVRGGCQDASFGLAAASALSAVLSVRLALERGRSVPYWLFKSALAGPASLLELRPLPPLGAKADA